MRMNLIDGIVLQDNSIKVPLSFEERIKYLRALANQMERLGKKLGIKG